MEDHHIIELGPVDCDTGWLVVDVLDGRGHHVIVVEGLDCQLGLLLVLEAHTQGLVADVEGVDTGDECDSGGEGLGKGIITESLLNTLLMAVKRGYFSPHLPLKSSVSTDHIIPPANCMAFIYWAFIDMLSMSSKPTHCRSLNA